MRSQADTWDILGLFVIVINRIYGAHPPLDFINILTLWEVKMT